MCPQIFWPSIRNIFIPVFLNCWLAKCALENMIVSPPNHELNCFTYWLVFKSRFEWQDTLCHAVLCQPTAILSQPSHSVGLTHRPSCSQSFKLWLQRRVFLQCLVWLWLCAPHRASAGRSFGSLSAFYHAALWCVFFSCVAAAGGIPEQNHNSIFICNEEPN